MTDEKKYPPLPTVSRLAARHRVDCAVLDPTRGPCTCGAVWEPLVRLSVARAAIDSLRSAPQEPTAADQALGLYAVQANEIRELLDKHAPATRGNLTERVKQLLEPAAFPPRILSLLQEMAKRAPGGLRGPWEDENGEPLQDDADAALRFIEAAQLQEPSPLSVVGLEEWAAALEGLLDDTQHRDHNCGEGPCPVSRARRAFDAITKAIATQKGTS